MSQFHFDPSNTQAGDLHFTNMLSIISFALASILHFAAEITPDDFYKWFFRALSTVSLCLVIAINYRKLWPKKP